MPRALAVRRPGRWRAMTSGVLPVVVACALASGALIAGVPGAAVGLAIVLLWPRVAAAAARRRAVRAAREALPDACYAIAATLRSGAGPPDALVAAAEGAPPVLSAVLRRAASTARLGGDPAGVFADPALGPGGVALASAWSALASGASLGDLTFRLGQALAADASVRREVAAQVAGPYAAAVLLAALPAVGMLLAAASGAQPLRFLLHTPAGLACLAAGLALDAAGVAWLRAVVRAAVPP